MSILVACVALVSIPGCAGHTQASENSPDSLRFVLKLSSSAREVIYAQDRNDYGTVGWISLSHEGRRVDLSPRCDIPDCGLPSAGVCGAAIPQVVELEPGDSAVFDWDKTMSVVETSDATGSGLGKCERRERASEGEYTVKICHSTKASPLMEMSSGEDSKYFPGNTGKPVCEERVVDISEASVVEVEVGGRSPTTSVTKEESSQSAVGSNYSSYLVEMKRDAPREELMRVEGVEDAREINNIFYGFVASLSDAAIERLEQDSTVLQIRGLPSVGPM